MNDSFSFESHLVMHKNSTFTGRLPSPRRQVVLLRQHHTIGVMHSGIDTLPLIGTSHLCLFFRVQ